MLKSITLSEMEQLIRADHPHWVETAIRSHAEEYIRFTDDRLDSPLRTYLDTGKMTELEYGEFSLLLIRSLRRCCSYLDAILLMDAYIKDARNGRALILRR